MTADKPTIEKLDPIAAMTARSLALGLDYEDIAVQTGLSVEDIAKVARGNLVKKRMREIQKEIDQQLVEDAAASPVVQYLKGKSMRMAETLVAEAENYNREEQGATASTRIKAATEVLGLAGFQKQEEKKTQNAVIMISAEKVELGRDIIENNIKTMPDFVDG
jgi:uncharacterized protein YdbL (DUF1318 family)